jgi:hypothetical protein
LESSCELDNEPLGSIKFWELSHGCTICGLLSGTQLHRVSYLSVLKYGVETLEWSRRDISGLHEVPIQHQEIYKKG